jgi:hypothetical protein
LQEKIQLKKTIRAHEERNVKSDGPAEPSTEALPSYLLDRSNEKNAKALSSAMYVASASANSSTDTTTESRSAKRRVLASRCPYPK